jgi:hypothetical protein
MEFKDYKEKQAYYKNRAKKENMIWESTAPRLRNGEKNPLIKGKTYINYEKRKKK